MYWRVPVRWQTRRRMCSVILSAGHLVVASAAPSLPRNSSAVRREFVMTGCERFGDGRQMVSYLRRCLVVTSEQCQSEVVKALLVERDGWDVVVFESIARGYSSIRQLRPDLIVLVLGIEDVAGWEFLSMLTNDRDVSGIPVVTYVVTRDGVTTIGENYRDLWSQTIGRPGAEVPTC